MESGRSGEANIKAGLFMLVALIAFGSSVFLLGKERRIFASTETFFTSMSGVGGLSVGAPVRMGGITVGRVADIGFGPDPTVSIVEVAFSVEKKYLDRIRADTVVSIETQGLLGDKFLALNPGVSRTSEIPLPPGATLQSREPVDISQILVKAQAVVDNTVDISDAIAEVLDKVKTETIKDFSESMDSIATITREIKEGDGVAHRLIYSDKDAESTFDSIESASKNIDQLVKDLKSGDGLLSALIYDPKGKEFVQSVNLAAQNLAETSNRVSEIAREIQEGSGVMHQLVYEDSPDITGKINKTIENLEATATSLKKAADALATGEGTLGALLVDAQLYDNMVEITSGAKKSFILRQAIKSSMK